MIAKLDRTQRNEYQNKDNTEPSQIIKTNTEPPQKLEVCLSILLCFYWNALDIYIQMWSYLTLI